MTVDDLDKKIINIKKRGLSKLVEIQLIGEVKGQFYKERIKNTENSISAQFHKNIEFLSAKLKSFPSASNIKEFMGITPDQYYDSFIKNKSNIFSLSQVLLASQYYGLPIDLLLFHDLSLHVEHLRKEYPAIFKQGLN